MAFAVHGLLSHFHAAFGTGAPLTDSSRTETPHLLGSDERLISSNPPHNPHYPQAPVLLRG